MQWKARIVEFVAIVSRQATRRFGSETDDGIILCASSRLSVMRLKSALAAVSRLSAAAGMQGLSFWNLCSAVSFPRLFLLCCPCRSALPLPGHLTRTHVGRCTMHCTAAASMLALRVPALVAFHKPQPNMLLTPSHTLAHVLVMLNTRARWCATARDQPTAFHSASAAYAESNDDSLLFVALPCLGSRARPLVGHAHYS